MFMRLAAISLLICTSASAFAHDAPPPQWTGEGAFTAGVTTGNTETTDVGRGLKLRHEGGE